jgi:hypothetical protein
MLLGFRDRDWVGVDKMAYASISANQNELPEGWAGAASLEQPEETFDCHIHDLIGRFFARRQMDDVAYPIQGILYRLAMLYGAAHNLEPVIAIEHTLVA